jgi:hypothetical protein
MSSDRSVGCPIHDAASSRHEWEFERGSNPNASPVQNYVIPTEREHSGGTHVPPPKPEEPTQHAPKDNPESPHTPHRKA